MRARAWLAIGLGAAVAVGGVAAVQMGFRPLPTGKWITPEGFQTPVGNFPANMALSPDGRYAVVTNTGFRQYLSVLDSDTGAKVAQVDSNGGGRGQEKEALYYGLAFAKRGDRTLLFASRGDQDLVSEFELGRDGKLKAIKDLDDPAPDDGAKIPHHVAGLDANADGTLVYAVNNQTYPQNGMRGSLSVIDVEADKVVRTIPLGGFPLAIAALNQGPHAGHRVFVTSERDGNVAVVDPTDGSSAGTVETGALPAYVRLNRDGTRLYVSNSGSDTVSEVDTDTLKVLRTFLLRPAAYRGLPGSTPLGLDLAPDGKRLFVAMADLNAVAVVDLGKGELQGYLPAGWYPTATLVAQDGDRLLVANAKGVQARNPNGTPVRKGARNQYGPVILEGTVASLDLSQALDDLPGSTAQVLRNNLADRPLRTVFQNPGIKHVVYVIKENRTYDQVLGDLPKGDNDPSLTLFGRDVTPNGHALAERFALLDDFYVCAEVSADGWNWSTSGMANEYNERNVFTNYSNRGRNYDFEGTNNGVSVEKKGLRDVSTAPGGYLWDTVVAKGLPLRNYGMFVAFDEDNQRPETRIMHGDGVPTKKALDGRTAPDFRRFDMAYADSEAWVRYGLKPLPRQLVAYGEHGDPSRISAWKREFAGMVKTGKMPAMTLMRLGRDHTSGTTPGQPTPEACVADNDYAVGQLVDAISHSPFWKSTAIVVLEDDAQAGFDHVDCHRSPCWVISPFVAKATHDATFYNTDGALRTMGLLLGTAPMNQYVATATPFGFFAKSPTNDAPYTAILPKREIVAGVNTRESYRAADSARMLNPLQEESGPDEALNDVLWGAIKGAKTPRPHTPNVRWSPKDADD